MVLLPCKPTSAEPLIRLGYLLESVLRPHTLVPTAQVRVVLQALLPERGFDVLLGRPRAYAQDVVVFHNGPEPSHAARPPHHARYAASIGTHAARILPTRAAR